MSSEETLLLSAEKSKFFDCPYYICNAFFLYLFQQNILSLSYKCIIKTLGTQYLVFNNLLKKVTFFKERSV